MFEVLAICDTPIWAVWLAELAEMSLHGGSDTLAEAFAPRL